MTDDDGKTPDLHIFEMLQDDLEPAVEHLKVRRTFETVTARHVEMERRGGDEVVDLVEVHFGNSKLLLDATGAENFRDELDAALGSIGEGDDD